jgi:hypothetical protein
MQQVLPAAVTDGINERINEALGAAEHVLPPALVVEQEFDNFQCYNCHAPLTRAPRGRPAKKKKEETQGRCQEG